MDLIIRKCMKCGAMIEVLNDCTCDNCGIQCCGEKMRTFVPNAEDASFEKHLPGVEVEGNEIVVNVPHVMEEDHYIEWIEFIANGLKQRQMLKIGAPAQARFPYIKGGVVYSYCNKHGLWRAEVK